MSAATTALSDLALAPIPGYLATEVMEPVSSTLYELESEADRAREDADLQVPFAEGELLRTEISAKFRRDGFAGELTAAGLPLRCWWTHPQGDYARALATKPVR